MALSEDNQDWVRQEILKAIRPNGWRKVANWLRYWSLLAVCVTVLVALIGIVVTLGIFATNRISQESEFRGTTGQQLKTIDQRLSNIETSIVAIRIGQAADKPTSKKNVADAKRILESATKNAIRLPTNIVEQSGKNFIEAATKEPAAWDAAQAFLDYRSVLNAPSMPTGQVRDRVFTHYTIDNLLNLGKATLRVIGTTDAADAAQLRHINGPDLNQRTPTQPSFLVYDNATFLLDTMYLRRVIFRNSHIIYKGGPVVLQDVYFINCTFEIERQPAGQSLANAILSSEKNVTFKSS